VLRGLEGQAARVYFAGMRSLLGDVWGFTARQKQPPPDPVNALLSLGYTLLYHSVAGLLQARGLNAHLGFLHAAGGDHMALASDVMEEFRSVVVDALVLDWCLNGKVSPADFSTSPDGCALSADATRRFIRAYEERLGTGSQWAWPGDDKGADLRRRVDWQAMRLAQALHAQDASLYLQSSYR
jgi:CRISP-associated protein Cas1